jgi:hypothetical protein
LTCQALGFVWCACAGQTRAPSNSFEEFTTTTTTTAANNAANTIKASPRTETPDVAQKLREQLLSTVQHSQRMSLEAAQTWVKAVSVLPIPDMPTIAGSAAVPSLEAATKFTFDVAADLFSAQRDFALQLANVFTPNKSV